MQVNEALRIIACVYCVTFSYIVSFVGNLYWTDPKVHVIEMSRLDGSYRFVVVTGGLDKPTSVVVDPVRGLLFWSDAGKQPRIEQAALDGSNRKVLVNSGLTAVNDITVDFQVRSHHPFPLMF